MIDTEKPGLKMKKFSVRVYVVPSNLETLLTGVQARWETREIEGYTLNDAKKKAGIK